jgi:hypothetical protein
MSKYPGRVLSATPPSVSQSGASGVWTQEEVAQYAQENIWPTQFPEDPFFQDTVLLLHGDGTNGAQNNTFLDSSTNNFTITRNGNTTQGSFSPFSKPDGRWGNYFNGATSDAVQAPNNAVFDYGTGDVTVELWVYLNSLSAIQTFIDCGPTGGSGFTSWALDISTSGYVQFFSYVSGNLELYTATSNPLSTNQWYHIAYTRSSGTNYLFVNGVACTATGGITQQINSGGNPVTIGRGRYSGFERPTTGYFSNVRITKAGALYTSAFTPSTTPLTTAVGSGTVSLLTCQSNRFIDKSVNAFAITVLATPKVTPFSPFPITTEYSPSVNGGSGYFDGSGDYLSVASNAAFDLGTGAFTWESWVYVTSSSNTAFIHGISAGFIVNFASSKPVVRLFGVADILTASDTLALNSWNHIAIARSGTTLSMWINGSRSAGGTVTDSSNFGQTGFNIGAINDGTAVYTGYMSSQRLVKGTAVYDPTQTTITIPTAPLTAIANTSLLCNFTNAGIFDNTGFNNLETAGDVQLDSTIKKFGTASIEFDGANDALVYRATDHLAFGTGDYTVECWVYFNGIDPSTLQILFSSGDTGDAFFFHADANQLSVGTNSAFISNQATTFTTGVWYHVAACRSGTTLKLFQDGVQVGSDATDTTNWISTGLGRIGTNPAGTQPINGFIDDLRITKGVARYTTTFTPPTAAFPNIGEP